MDIKRRRHARIVLCPKSNPLIVYERRETSCSVVRMHQVLAGHVPTCQVSSQEKKKKKKKYCNFNEARALENTVFNRLHPRP